jgi:hypothetical protein
VFDEQLLKRLLGDITALRSGTWTGFDRLPCVIFSGEWCAFGLLCAPTEPATTGSRFNNLLSGITHLAEKVRCILLVGTQSITGQPARIDLQSSRAFAHHRRPSPIVRLGSLCARDALVGYGIGQLLSISSASDVRFQEPEELSIAAGRFVEVEADRQLLDLALTSFWTTRSSIHGRRAPSLLR